MLRITNDYINRTVINNIKKSLVELDKYNYQLSSGKQIQNPSDDPVGTINIMDLKNTMAELEQYVSNVEDGKNMLATQDQVLDDVTQILQRVREITLQGANDTYNAENKKLIATEVDQLIEEMLQLANTKYDGKYLFSGKDIYTETFAKEDFEGQVTGVSYAGSEYSLVREIERKTTMEVGLTGDEIFQVNRPVLTMGDGIITDPDTALNSIYGGLISSPEGKGYFKLNDTLIPYSVNGTDGDSLNDLADRINEAGAGVDASIEYNAADNSYKLKLTGTNSQSLWLEDAAGGDLLANLKFIKAGVEPPNNINVNDPSGAADASFESSSIFNVLINIRDHLNNFGQTVDGEEITVENIENDIKMLDEGFNNLSAARATLGSKSRRLELVSSRYDDFKMHYTELLSNVEDVDIAEVILKLKQQESVHKAALTAGARMIQPTLLDYLS